MRLVSISPARVAVYGGSEDVFCDENNLSQLAAASFGQTFNVTPIQMITAVAAACNGGISP